MAGGQSITKIKRYLSEQFSLAEEQIESMLPGFVATLHSHMQNLEGTVVDKDPVMIGRAAHTIKGALLNLGLEECARTASLIEEKGRAGDRRVEFKPLMDELRNCVDPVLSSFPPESPRQ